MKTLRIISILIISVGLASCTTAYMGSVPYDDVYYSSSYAPPPAETQPAAQSSARYYQNPVNRQTDYNNNEQNYDSRDFSTNQNRYASSVDEVVSEPDRQVNVYDYYDDDTYNNDDYYDYAYAVRIKRFHQPYIGIGYYDDYYTNLYWYNHNPYCWGTSIYSGYNWWGVPSFGFGWSWGWGSIGWNWGFPYSGYYGYGYGYGYPYWGGGSYWAGYNHGYWNGYWNGYYAGNYYNSYDVNSHYYGPRHNRGSSNGAYNNSNGSFGSLYESKLNSRRIGSSGNTGAVATSNSRPKFAGSTITERRKQASGTASNDRLSPNTRPTTANNSNQARIENATNTNNVNNARVSPGSSANTSSNTVAAENEGRTNSRVRVTGNNINQSATATAVSTDDPPANIKPQSTNVDARTQNAQSRYSNQNEANTPQKYNYSRYSRNAQEPATRNVEMPAGRDAKTYTPPAYSQPRSSNEYSSPRSRVITNPGSNRDNQNNVRESYQAPQQNNEQRSPVRYKAPQQNRNYQQPKHQQRSYDPPAQSQPSRNYNTPSQQETRSTYQAPSRSSESISTPSRSSNSYSSPSRSSGSSNSGNNNSGRRK